MKGTVEESKRKEKINGANKDEGERKMNGSYEGRRKLKR